MRRRASNQAPLGAALDAIVAIVALAVLISAPRNAEASMFDTYGFGARGTAMGGSMVALSDDYNSVYYNPANLLVTKRAHLGFGLNLIAPFVTIDRGAGGDSSDLRARTPPLNVTFDLGTAAPLGGIFDNKLAFGILLFHPLVSFTKVESIDPRFPYLYRYANSPSKLIIAAAIAYEPVEWLRIGLGVQLLAQLEGRFDAALSLSERRFTREEVDAELLGTASPTAGLSIGPFEGVRFGLAYRHELALRYRLPIRALIEEVGNLDVLIDGISLYTPMQLAAGLSWEGPVGDGMTLAVEFGITWEHWSAAPPAGATFELTVDDSAIRAEEIAAGREVQNILEAYRDPIDLEARDTLTPRFGIELRPTPQWVARAGYFYRPTHLPEPRHQGNFLGANAHGISLGGGVAIGDPTGVIGAPLMIDLALQVTLLENRVINKAEGFSPGGAFQVGGPILNASVAVHHNF